MAEPSRPACGEHDGFRSNGARRGTPPARELTVIVLQPGWYEAVRNGTGDAERAVFRAWVSHVAI